MEIHAGLFLWLPPGLWLCLGVALLFFCFVFVFSAQRLLPALWDATCTEAGTSWRVGQPQSRGFGAQPGADRVPGGEIQP